MIAPIISGQLAFERNRRRQQRNKRDWLGRTKTQKRKAAAKRRARQRRHVVVWKTANGRTHRRRFPTKTAANEFARTLRARKVT